MPDCQHEHFEVEAVVERVWSGQEEGEGDLALHSTIKIRCGQCRARFGFPGLSMGLVWDRPTTDAGGLELRAPLRPEAHLTSMMADLPGFEINMPTNPGNILGNTHGVEGGGGEP